jgi:NADPH2:quinone reductase
LIHRGPLETAAPKQRPGIKEGTGLHDPAFVDAQGVPPMTAQATMRAAIAEAPRAPFRVTSIPRPAPTAGQVLVRIHAAGVNPLDIKIHAGQAPHARQALPAILGLDLAGTVEAVGEGATRFHRGDEVYGMTGGVGGNPGTLAEFSAVDERLLARKPANLSMRATASLPLVTITAWEGLVDRAGVAAGQNVLVQGGGGGVGHIVVQIARSFGAQVFATGSGRKRDFIEGLGATFIDYKSETVASYVDRCTGGRGFDVVYDTAGGVSLDASFEAVRRFGHVVSALGWGTHALAPLSFRAATYSGVFTLLPLLTGKGRDHHAVILETARTMVEAGNLIPALDPRCFTLETVGDAYSLVESGEASGKVVIDIVGSS